MSVDGPPWANGLPRPCDVCGSPGDTVAEQSFRGITPAGAAASLPATSVSVFCVACVGSIFAAGERAAARRRMATGAPGAPVELVPSARKSRGSREN